MLSKARAGRRQLGRPKVGGQIGRYVYLMSACPYCTAEVPQGDKRCPACRRELLLNDEDAYELTDQSTDIPLEWQGGSVYALELPARCPHCREVIQTLRVLRLRRTQVPFTSTLPR